MATAKNKSAKSLVVYSTLAADQIYTRTEPGGGDLPQTVAQVFIRGGAGVANDRIVTPMGVTTLISPDELEVLKGNAVWKMHEANGYVFVSDESVDAEKVAADMNATDPSRPLSESDLSRGGADGINVVSGTASAPATTAAKKK